MYVLVDYHRNIGLPFHSLHPTYIPIPPHTARCKYNCGCQKIYIPLTLAFGKTIHSFQGPNVGATCPHQPQNPIQTIVVDPGTRAFEGSSPCLLYSVISRITTLGYPHDIFTSPLFFTGFNMTRERLQHITLRKDGRTYAKVLLRKKWVAFLKQCNKSTTPLSTQQKHQIASWIHSYRCSTAAVASKIMLYSELLSKLPPV